jgi:DNA-directed RNA polymerase I subunit RPA12
VSTFKVANFETSYESTLYKKEKEVVLEGLSRHDKANKTKKKNKHAVVDEPCPQEACDSKQLNFYTLQIRSVDEGQTVFYECPKCGHKWNLDN